MLPRRLATSSVAALRRLSTKSAVAEAFDAAKSSSEEESFVEDKKPAASAARGRDTLGRRLFALVHPKRSAAAAVRKWKEEGHVVQKYELNRFVRELRKLKRYKHALEICEWMRTQKDIQLTPGDYAVHLDLISKIRGLNSAEKFFIDLPEKMRSYETCTALLHTYVQHSEPTKAEALMDKMSESGFLKCPLPFNHMLSMYISKGELEKVPSMIQELKKTTSPDVVTYNLWLASCASQNLIETAEEVFLELKNAKIEPDWVTYSTLTSIYIKNSLQDKAEATLKEMEKKVSKKIRVAHQSLISLHTGMGHKEAVSRVWKNMKFTYRKLSDAEYTCMIASLLKLKELTEAKKLYDEWEVISPTKDSRIPNLLLAYYINNNRMENAEEFYSRMVKKGIKIGYTTWELLTWGHLKQKRVDSVLDCFKKAVTSVKKWDPNKKLLQEVCSIVEESGNVEDAEKMIVILRDAGYIDTEVYNSLLRTYAKAGKMPLIIEERMEKDKVDMDEETKRLLQVTSKMPVGEIPTVI